MSDKSNIERIGKELIRKYPYVNGFSKKLRKRIRDGKVVDEMCLQVHVSKKITEKYLRVIDRLPTVIEGIPIDVVVYGKHDIPLPPIEAKVVAKTGRHRPLVAGISIGNAAITAGTLGNFLEKLKSPDKGMNVVGTNGHVLADDPQRNPEDVVERRILQPGSADGGGLVDVIGHYYWHKRVAPLEAIPPCTVSNVTINLLNGIAWLARQTTRFTAYADIVNNIDFAVSKIDVQFKDEFIDITYPPEKFDWCGYGFAGGELSSLGCKASYIKLEGYAPRRHEVVDVSIGDIIHKTGRTSCHNFVAVLDDSAYQVVGFGAYQVGFDDIFVMQKMLDPGDSGSGIYRERT